MAERSEVLEQEAVRDASPGYSVEAGSVSAEDVPKGYKRTEVGVMPKDWEVRNLGELCYFENGDRGSNYPSPGSFVLDGIPFVNAGHIKDGRIYLDKMDYITEDKYERLGGGKVKTGDILFCLRGTLGKYGVVESNFGRAAIASSLVIVRTKHNIIHREFLAIYFASNFCDRMIDKWAGGAAQPNLGAQDLKRFTICFPSLQEQRAIATALSDADALIEFLDRLIAKKRAIKQAAMQQLLTGQTRLPGFTGEWETKRLGDIAEIDPENLCVNTPGNYTFSYISLEQVEEGRLLGWSTERFRTAPSRARRVLREGDILVSTVRPNLKSHLKFSGQFPDAVCSTGFAVVRCAQDLAEPGYIYAHCFGSLINRQIERIIAGSNYPAISSSDVRRLELPLPCLEEQTAIATVLSDMDTEIEALEHRRDKARQIKQGMMQQLLTGRVRLVAPESLAEAAV